MLRKIGTIAGALTLTTALTGAAQAQDAVQNLGGVLAEIGAAASAGQSRHLINFGIDNAVVMGGDTLYVAGTFANPRGGIPDNLRSGGDFEENDLGLAIGYAFGDPFDAVGVSVAVNIDGIEGGFGESGGFVLKVSKGFAGGGGFTFVGATASNVLPWGDADDQDTSGSVAVTHVRNVGGLPVMMTVGYGTDAAYDDPLTLANETTGSLFAGVGLGVSENFSFSVSGSNGQVNAGVGIKVPAVEGLSVIAGFNDVLADQDRRQASITVAYSFDTMFGGL